MPALRENPGVRERSFRPSQRANPARVPVPYFGYTYGDGRLLLSLPQPAFVSCNWLQRHRNKKAANTLTVASLLIRLFYCSVNATQLQVCVQPISHFLFFPCSLQSLCRPRSLLIS